MRLRRDDSVCSSGIRLQLTNLRLGTSQHSSVLFKIFSGQVSAQKRNANSSSSDKDVHSVSPGGGASPSCNMARFVCVKKPKVALFLKLLVSLFHYTLISNYSVFSHLTKVRLRRDDVRLLRNQTPTFQPSVAGGLRPPDPPASRRVQQSWTLCNRVSVHRSIGRSKKSKVEWFG